MTEPSAKLLATVVDLAAKRKLLDQQVRAIEAELDPLKKSLREWLESLDKRSVQRHGYRITLVEGRANPRWKDLFTALAGHAATLKATQDAAKLQLLDVQLVERQ